MTFLMENNNQISCILCRMVLEWREREHGDVEEVMQTDVKSNLYASLDIIPEIGMNGSKQQSKRRSKWTPTSSY